MPIARAFLIAAAALASACASAGRTPAWESDPLAGAIAATSTASSPRTAEALQAFVARDDKVQLLRAIALFSRAIEEEPADVQALTGLARAYDFLAEAFLAIEEAPLEVRLETHQKSLDYAERGMLAADPVFASKMRSGVSFEDAVRDLRAPAVGPAFWYAMAGYRFARAKGLRARLYYQDRLLAVIERVQELAPEYYFGGPDRFLGLYYLGLSLEGRRDVGRSEQHFNRSLAAAPEFLLTRVAEADTLAIVRDDEGQYRQLLEAVLAGAVGADPELAPENRTAKRLAERMLAQIQERF